MMPNIHRSCKYLGFTWKIAASGMFAAAAGPTPPPSGDGQNCTGEASEEKDCNTDACSSINIRLSIHKEFEIKQMKYKSCLK